MCYIPFHLFHNIYNIFKLYSNDNSEKVNVIEKNESPR